MGLFFALGRLRRVACVCLCVCIEKREETSWKVVVSGPDVSSRIFLVNRTTVFLVVTDNHQFNLLYDPFGGPTLGELCNDLAVSEY